MSASVPSRRVDVALELPSGRSLALLGPNGAGKSTVLSVLAGLVVPDAGRVVLDGRTLVDVGTGSGARAWVPAHRRRVALLAQDPLLFPHLDVLDNVAFGPRSAGRSRHASREVARHWLARVDAADLADRPARALSGGQAQRVAIVRALAMQPELMLFDEITSALDPLLVGEVLDAVRDLKAGGLTIVMATHEMGFAREVADRVCFLHDGVVREQGSPEQVFGDPQEPQTREFLARVLG